MTGRCEGGHVVPLRELNLVTIGVGVMSGGHWHDKNTRVALVCNDCIADAFAQRNTSEAVA